MFFVAIQMIIYSKISSYLTNYVSDLVVVLNLLKTSLVEVRFAAGHFTDMAEK